MKWFLLPVGLLFVSSCFWTGPDIGEVGKEPDPRDAENQRFSSFVDAYLA